MKRLLILSLLIMQGVWGAAAFGADDYEGEPAQQQEAQQTATVTTSDGVGIEYQYPGWSNTLNNLLEALPDSNEAIPVNITATAFNLVQNLCLQMEQNNGLFSDVPSWLLQDSKKIYELLLAANLLNPKGGFETFIKTLYVAWLNANVTQPIVVRQTALQACHQMGIDAPEGFEEFTVDIKDALIVNGIKSLDKRSNSISWLIYTNKIILLDKGDFSNKNIAICDGWNIKNPKDITSLDLSNNQLTTIDAWNLPKL